MMKKVAFEALIKEVKVKSLVSGDRSARILIELDSPSDELLADIISMQRPYETVSIALVENPKTGERSL
jgi:hypothetical protein